MPAVVVAALAAALVVVVYGGISGVLSLDLMAPDHTWIDTGPDAVRALSMDEVWGGPTPPGRGDLGTYRPVHATLLRMQYGSAQVDVFGATMDSPGAPVRTIRVVNLSLFALGVFFTVLLVGRLLQMRARPGRDLTGALVAAAIVIALHPMATEAVVVASAQSALLGFATWSFALWIFQLAREGRIPHVIAAVPITAAVFIAIGAHEIGFLLPLALLALDRLGDRPGDPGLAPVVTQDRTTSRRKKAARDARERKSGDETDGGSAEPPRWKALGEIGWHRFLLYGLPLIGVVRIMIALRRNALDGSLGPLAAAGSLADQPVAMRMLASVPILARALTELIAPFSPTYFYSVQYDPGVFWSVGLSALLIGLVAGAAVILRGRWCPLALGTALVLVPMLALLHAVPLSVDLSERLLIFALPGLGLLVGYAVMMGGAATRQARAVSFVACLVLAGALGSVTLLRCRAWADPEQLWAAEAERHPADPRPMTYEMIEVIGKSQTQFDMERIEDLALGALDKAHPPDQDPIYQSLVSIYLGTGDRENLADLFGEAMAAPEPHEHGYYSRLGIATFRLGLVDEARAAMTAQENSTQGSDFESAFIMAQILEIDEQWGDSAEYSRLAVNLAPRHLQPMACLLWGRSTAKLGAFEESAGALLKIVMELDPGMGEAYMELARLYLDNGHYELVEQTLVRARDNARFSTFRDLYSIQVQALEQQNKVSAALDMLNEMMGRHPWDQQLAVYAGDYFLRRGQPERADAIYRGVLASAPNNANAMAGLGKMAWAIDDNTQLAEQYFRRALAAEPANPYVNALMARLIEAKKNSGGSGPTEGPPVDALPPVSGPAAP